MKQSVKMQEKMTMVAYEAPMVEVIEVEVEKGFAASIDGAEATVLDVYNGWGN